VHVLVIGATGYIGGRLVPELLARGHGVRCGARTPSKLDPRPWRDDVEVVEADVFDRASLDAAVAGCDAVYFLVHSMDGAGDFAERDRRAAANVRDASAAAGVGRLLFLGGLGAESDELSEHLRSRHEVGRVLADGPVPVTELRAAIIIGSGSASFEMLRNLCEVLPVMTTPKWVDTRVQPIAVRDVLFYLCEVLEVPATAGRVLEIGGPDVLTYRQLMHVYAEVAGLRHRLILPIPVLTPKLSSLWIGLVTPLPTGLARPLVDSLVNEVVVTDHTIDELVPRETVSFRDAVAMALQRVQDLDVATTWASAGGRRSARARAGGVDGDADRRRGEDVPEDPQPDDPAWSGGTVLTDRRRITVPTAAGAAFAALAGDVQAGGTPGTAPLAARLPGRWRVEVRDEPRFLRLRSEDRLPGDLWLELRFRDEGDGTRVEQLARFHPRGLGGRVSWIALLPAHAYVAAARTRELLTDVGGPRVTHPTPPRAPRSP
jgi:uncharacterized protein YbjT (DUF2867 family)